ncbi:MAG: chitinase [Lachnospiraceae bacterium]|nr:chitinase [Lachnospiraceae bacterium]
MKKIIPVLVAIVLIVVIGAVAFGGQIIEKYSYSKERADLDAYFGITAEDEIAIILQNEVIEEKAKLIGSTVYFDFATVEKYFTDRFYVNKEEKLLLFTTADDVIRIQIGDDSDVIYVSDIGNSLEYKAALYEGDILYIAAEYIKKYVNMSYSLYGDPMHMQVYTEWSMVNEAKITEDTAVRIRGGIKSEILTDVAEGDKVIVLEEMETWSKVKTQTGFIGYVENKQLGSVTVVEQVPVKEAMEVVINSIQKEGTVNMVFHQVFDADSNSKPSKLLKNTKGVNVIAPTWFRLSDNEGNFTSIASEAYVANAHEMGVEVWALITDVDSKSLYGVDIDFYELLSSSANRERLIDGLMAQVDTYDLDGINIDFEQVKSSAGTHFIQFLRELSIETRKRGVILSVDNYVPTEYTAHYNRKEQGLVVDYVVIMGYDEHYAGGGVAGSNASIDYVEQGIIKTKESVPAHKIINAIPFYTKVWESGSEGLNVATLTMENQAEWVSKSGVEPVWLEEFCQSYVEFERDGKVYQCWLEDEESVKVKLQVMKAQDIAGVAAWKLGIEDTGIWEVISQYTAGSM